MALFEDQTATEAVKPNDIRNMTGIKASDFYFDQTDEEQALDELLGTWIERIAAHIEVRGINDLAVDSAEYIAIQDIIIRTVAKLVATAQQQRTSPIIQIDDFAVSILNTSEVVEGLEKELKPFTRSTGGRLSVFSSIGDYDEEEDEV